jgi:thiol-disulfide isomerase/thioredoxin
MPSPMLFAVIASGLLALSTTASAEPLQNMPTPEFTQTTPDAWINGPPQRIADFRGKVILLDVWTFGCWNCYRSFPWLNDLEARLAPEGLAVIGVHSPEFDHERERAAVAAKVQEFGLEHPVMLDNDFRYWKALDNRAWPAFYLIDKQGRLRHRFYGETHAGDARARRIERAVLELLREDA